MTVRDALNSAIKEEMQRDLGTPAADPAMEEEENAGERIVDESQQEAPTEIISSDPNQPFVWHGDGLTGDTDVAIDESDSISSYTPPEKTTPEEDHAASRRRGDAARRLSDRGLVPAAQRGPARGRTASAVARRATGMALCGLHEETPPHHDILTGELRKGEARVRFLGAQWALLPDGLTARTIAGTESQQIR